MIVIDNANDCPNALPYELHALLDSHLSLARLQGLESLTVLLVIQPDDIEADVVAELGFSPVTNPITAIHYDDPEFEPYWAWLTKAGRWFQLVHTVSDDGFAFILLIENAESQFADLVAMCRAWAA
jgi:hypothetical protein